MTVLLSKKIKKKLILFESTNKKGQTTLNDGFKKKVYCKISNVIYKNLIEHEKQCLYKYCKVSYSYILTEEVV